MKLGLRISVWVLGVLGLLAVANFGLGLLNKPDDVQFVLGVLVLLVVLTVVVGVARHYVINIIKYVKDKEDNVKKTLLIVMMFGLLVSASACTRIGPGYVGIKVSLAGDSRGVNDIPMTTGWVFYLPWASQVFEYPTFVQTAVWTKDAHEGSANNEEISFNTKEGLIVTGDISLSYQLKDSMVPHFYVKFRSDDLNRFTHGYLRNVARDIFNEVAGKYAVEEIYGPKKEAFLNEVRSRLNDQVKMLGVQIEQFGFIGAPRPPESVIQAINLKIAATQNAIRAENEVRQTEAEAKKAIAKAEGEARANQILTSSINENLIKWKTLELTARAVEKWNGQRPLVEGQNSGLLISLPIQK